jgi:hypothetical protein
MEKLLGQDDNTAVNTSSANFIGLGQYTAVKTGVMKLVRIKISAAGNFKFALYADSGDAPAALINSLSSTALTGTGWKDVVFPDSNIVLGTKYWLGFKSDTDQVISFGTGGVLKYKNVPFADAWANPAGSGYSDINYQLLISGWEVPSNGSIALLNLL